MATVPIYTRKVTTEPLAAPRLSAPNPAEGIAAVGRGLTDAGNAGMDIALDYKRKGDQVAVQDADNLLATHQIKAESELDAADGLDAIELSTRILGDFDSQADRVGAGLANETQRQAFQRSRQLRRQTLDRAVQVKTAKAIRQHDDNTTQVAVDAAKDSAIANATDPQRVGLEVSRAKAALADFADRHGLDKDITERKQAEVTSDIHKGVIARLLNQGNDLAAEGYYKATKAAILGRDRGEIERALEVGSRLGKAQAEADRVVAKGLDEAAALEEVAKRTKSDPALRREAEAEVSTRYAKRRQIDLQHRADVRLGAWQTVMAGGSVSDLTVEQRLALQPADLPAMMAWEQTGGRGPAKTDLDKWEEAYQGIEQGDITTQQQLDVYRPFLSRSDYQGLLRRFEKRGIVSDTEARRAFTDRLGKTTAKWSDKNREQWIAFQGYITERVQETRRPEDLDKWADRWFMEGRTRETGFLVNDPDTLGEAIAAGRGNEFLFDIPSEVEGDVRATMTLAEAPANTSQAFYTQHYLPALDWLAAHDIEVTAATAAAVVKLRASNKPMLPENVYYVASLIARGRSSASGAPERAPEPSPATPPATPAPNPSQSYPTQ